MKVKPQSHSRQQSRSLFGHADGVGSHLPGLPASCADEKSSKVFSFTLHFSCANSHTCLARSTTRFFTKQFEYPEIIAELVADNTAFLTEVKNNSIYKELPVLIIGNPQQREIKLTIQHAIGEDKGIWKPEQVAAGMKNTNNTHALKIEQKGII